MNTLPQCGRGSNGRQGGLDGRQDLVDGLAVGLPGEVERDGLATEGGAHPQLVGRDRPDLGDLERDRDPIADRIERQERVRRVLPRDQVLGLELIAGARRVIHPEVGHPLMPRTGDAELLGECRGRHPPDGVDRDRRPGRPEQLGCWFERVAIDHPPLEPDLLERGTPPVGEQADAVRQ